MREKYKIKSNKSFDFFKKFHCTMEEALSLSAKLLAKYMGRTLMIATFESLCQRLMNINL